MSTHYFKKRAAAQWQAENEYPITVHDHITGQEVEINYAFEVKHSDGFPNYFIFRISGLIAEPDKENELVSSYHLFSLSDAEPYMGLRPLKLYAVVPWLEVEFGSEVDVDDCDYFSDILREVVVPPAMPKQLAQLNIDRALEWLTSKKASLMRLSTPTAVSSIKWEATDTELVELAYALSEAGAITGTKKEIIEALSGLFGLGIKTPVSVIVAGIKKRKNDGETRLLDKLKKAFNIWLNKE
jgi:hypothetical protein